jgi:hypothetical protein
MGRSYYAVFVRTKAEVARALEDVHAHDNQPNEEDIGETLDGGDLFRVRRDGRLYFEATNGGGQGRTWRFLEKSPLKWFTPMYDPTIGENKDFSVASCGSKCEDPGAWHSLADYDGIEAPIVAGSSAHRLAAATASLCERATPVEASSTLALSALMLRACPSAFTTLNMIEIAVPIAKSEGEAYHREMEAKDWVRVGNVRTYRMPHMRTPLKRKTVKEIADERKFHTVEPGSLSVAYAPTLAAEGVIEMMIHVKAAASALTVSASSHTASAAHLVVLMAQELADDVQSGAKQLRASAGVKTVSEWAEEDAEKLLRCNGCYKRGTVEKPLLLCGRCFLLSYCSNDCQKKKWPDHKATCHARVVPAPTLSTDA